MGRKRRILGPETGRRGPRWTGGLGRILPNWGRSGSKATLEGFSSEARTPVTVHPKHETRGTTKLEHAAASGSAQKASGLGTDGVSLPLCRPGHRGAGSDRYRDSRSNHLGPRARDP